MHKIWLLLFLFYCSMASKTFLVETKGKEATANKAEYEDVDSSYSTVVEGISEKSILVVSFFI